jgi:uncharacterized membrane protein
MRYAAAWTLLALVLVSACFTLQQSETLQVSAALI